MLVAVLLLAFNLVITDAAGLLLLLLLLLLLFFTRVTVIISKGPCWISLEFLLQLKLEFGCTQVSCLYRSHHL
jgi:hypothetical protein